MAVTKGPNRWEGLYHVNEAAETSWFASHLQVSLALIAATGIGTDAAIVDMRAGALRLLYYQLKHGFHQITVLDFSETVGALHLSETAPNFHPVRIGRSASLSCWTWSKQAEMRAV